MSLQFRRGPLADLATITPLAGEPIWTTDTNKLYVGDGVTPGGIIVSSTATGVAYNQSLNTTDYVKFSRVTLLPDQSGWGRLYTPRGYISTATTSNLGFEPSGQIRLDAYTDVGNTEERSILELSNGQFRISTISKVGGIQKLWIYDKDGIKFPDNTVQTTAFTGTASNPFDQTLNTTSTVAFANATITNTLYIGTDTTNTIGMIGDTFVIASTYPGGLSLDAGTSELLLAASNGIRLQAPLRSTSSNPITFDPGNGSVEPTFDAAADLGRTSKTWRNLYLVNTGTVFFGTNTVAVSSTGTLLVNGSEVSGSGTGDITFEGVKIQGAGSAGESGYSTIELVPDTDLYAISTSSGAFGNSGGQYLIIDPTSPQHIHIRAGGPIDQAPAQLILGGEKANVTVRDQDNSYIEKHYVTINTESTASTHYSWIFGDDGSLTFPDSSIQTTAGGTSVYERGGLPMGTPGQIITISDSGTDDNSPAGNWAPAYWDDDATEWIYIGNSNSVTAI